MEYRIKELLEQYKGVDVEEELNNNKLIVFGAGGSGLRIKTYLESLGHSISYFCDNDKKKQGKVFQDINVISPKDLASFNKSNYLVCIASEWRYDIAVQLNNIGIKFLDLFYWYSGWKDHFKASIIKKNIDNIHNAYSMLQDDQSKDVFISILKYRLTLDPSQLIIAKYKQYDHPLVSLKQGNAIIDGGAFDGRTTIYFGKKFKGSYKVFAFEPEKENYDNLVNNVEKYKAENVVAVPFGLWSKNTTSFINTNTRTQQSYFIDKEGDKKIDLVSLDSFCLKNNITPGIIKLDVEGSEIEALQGSIKVLESKKPNLIICVYHKPTDLWQIPLFLKSLNYKYYIAHHKSSLTESVLYCIS